MSLTKPVPKKEETCVDDVRRVREKLSDETGNDVNRLADHAQQITERLKEELGLKPWKA
ncbi:MAG: hypothetical protein IT449_03220 [Phycisphaerales bacterium]|nr:hypothetical protein [Phycisphaerales bacterium]